MVRASPKIYADDASAQDYFLARYGEVPQVWAEATQQQRTAALIEGTLWLDATFGAYWKGRKLAVEQERDWPRYDVFIGSFPAPPVIPQGVRDAAVEAALLEIRGELSLPDATDPDVRILSESGGVDVLRESITYAGQGKSLDDTKRRYPRIEALLRDYVTFSLDRLDARRKGGGARVIR